MPWPFSCSKPLDIKKRVPLIPAVCASRLACHFNVQMQLPRFPFGCYTNPDVAWLVCGAPSCTAPLAAGVGHGSSMTLGSPDVKSASGICAPAPIQSHFFAPPLSPPASAGSRCPLAALAAPPRLCRRRARPRALPPARDGSAPPLRAARRGAAERCLDRQWRMGYRSASGVSRGRGPRDHRCEDAEGNPKDDPQNGEGGL